MVDSRPVQPITYNFTGVKKELLLLGEDAPCRQQAIDLLIDQGYRRPELLVTIHELAASELLIEIDGRLLTLAILGDCQPLPTNEHHLFTELKL